MSLGREQNVFMNRLAFLKTLFTGAAGIILSPKPGGKSPSWLLNRCWIAGFAYHDGPLVRNQLRVDDSLEVRADFSNPHDRHAIGLWHQGSMIGYVPRSENRHLARLIQQGASLHARILELPPGADAWNAVRIEIGFSPT